MYKKSITRIENENDSSQADLSSPALHDIIATNHVVLAKVRRDNFFLVINLRRSHLVLEST